VGIDVAAAYRLPAGLFGVLEPKCQRSATEMHQNLPNLPYCPGRNILPGLALGALETAPADRAADIL
jgi:hypothetical protein